MLDYTAILVMAVLRQRLGEDEIRITRAELEQAERIKVETWSGAFGDETVVRIVVVPSDQ